MYNSLFLFLDTVFLMSTFLFFLIYNNNNNILNFKKWEEGRERGPHRQGEIDNINIIQKDKTWKAVEAFFSFSVS